MSLGPLMLVALMGLIISMIVYNIWPRLLLYRAGVDLEIAIHDLEHPSLTVRYQAAVDALGRHYNSARLDAHTLVQKIIPTVAERIILNDTLSRLGNENRVAVTRDGVDDLRKCTQQLREAAIDRTLAVRYPDFFLEYRQRCHALARRVERLSKAFGRLERVRPRLEKTPR